MRSLKIGRLLLVAPLLASVALALPPTTQAAITKPLKPLATTGSFTQPRGTSATLLGAVNPRGAATAYHFDYGPTIAYGKQTATANLAAGIVRVKVGQPVTGLLPGYHYRLVATNERGTTNGRDRIFNVKSSRTTKFTLVKPAEATALGGSLTLTGALSGTGGGNRRIELQQSPFPFLTPFGVVGLPILTNAAGAFSFHVSGLLLSTQFRANTLDPRPLYSPVVTQHVSARVTLKVRSAGSGLVRLYGTVTPAEVGARISFQLRKPARPGKSEKASERTTKFSSEFSSVVKRATKKMSRYSAVVKVRQTGLYRAYVQVPKGAVVAGASPTIKLHAAPGTSPKRK